MTVILGRSRNLHTGKTNSRKRNSLFLPRKVCLRTEGCHF